MAATSDKFSITKFFPFPRGLVYEAWTQSKHAENWGPSGLKIQLDYSDVQVGGSYRITMIGGDVYVNTGVYKEIVPDQKLVFTHGWEGSNRVDTVVTVEFKDKPNGTELVLTQTGFNDQTSASSHEAGWSSALENLNNYLGHLRSDESFLDGLA